jgi:hypothetical protein
MVVRACRLFQADDKPAFFIYFISSIHNQKGVMWKEGSQSPAEITRND